MLRLLWGDLQAHKWLKQIVFTFTGRTASISGTFDKIIFHQVHSTHQRIPSHPRVSKALHCSGLKHSVKLCVHTHVQVVEIRYSLEYIKFRPLVYHRNWGKHFILYYVNSKNQFQQTEVSLFTSRAWPVFFTGQADVATSRNRLATKCWHQILIISIRKTHLTFSQRITQAALRG